MDIDFNLTRSAVMLDVDLPITLSHETIVDLHSDNPEKVRYKVIGGKMKGMESSMKLVALGATQRKG